MAHSITLRKVKDGDLPIFFEHQLDPESNQMAAFISRDPTDESAFQAHWKRIRSDPTVTIRTILIHSQVAGMVASFVQDKKLEVTYWIGREFWGQGVATEALRQFLSIRLERPIHAAAAGDNAGSIRVLEKCGFKVTGLSAGYSNARGAEIDEVLLRLPEKPEGR